MKLFNLELKIKVQIMAWVVYWSVEGSKHFKSYRNPISEFSRFNKNSSPLNGTVTGIFHPKNGSQRTSLALYCYGLHKHVLVSERQKFAAKRFVSWGRIALCEVWSGSTTEAQLLQTNMSSRPYAPYGVFALHRVCPAVRDPTCCQRVWFLQSEFGIWG